MKARTALKSGAATQAEVRTEWGDQSDAVTGFERGDANASGRSSTNSGRVRERVCFDQIDCRPTIYHPGGIFEELAALPPELLRDPRAQSWGNVWILRFSSYLEESFKGERRCRLPTSSRLLSSVPGRLRLVISAYMSPTSGIIRSYGSRSVGW